MFEELIYALPHVGRKRSRKQLCNVGKPSAQARMLHITISSDSPTQYETLYKLDDALVDWTCAHWA